MTNKRTDNSNDKDKQMEDETTKTANSRSFDCASRDETARGYAQDDILFKWPDLIVPLIAAAGEVAGGDPRVGVRWDPERPLGAGTMTAFGSDLLGMPKWPLRCTRSRGRSSQVM